MKYRTFSLEAYNIKVIESASQKLIQNGVFVMSQVNDMDGWLWMPLEYMDAIYIYTHTHIYTYIYRMPLEYIEDIILILLDSE